MWNADNGPATVDDNGSESGVRFARRILPGFLAVLVPLAIEAQVPDSVIVVSDTTRRGPQVGHSHQNQLTIGPRIDAYPEVLAELRQENGPRTRAELDSIANMLVEWATSEDVIHREGVGQNMAGGRETGMRLAAFRSARTLRRARDVYEGAFDAIVRILEATESPGGADMTLGELRIADEARAVQVAAEVAARANAKSCGARRFLRYSNRGEAHPVYADLERSGAFTFACPELDRNPGDPGGR